MKKPFLLIFSFCITLLFSACEKVIDVKLNDSTPVIVIEGEINTIRGPYTVTVTQSKNFDENNTFAGRADAVVTITDLTTNVTETLANRGGGSYQSAVLQGVLGRSYQLTVVVDNKTYTATSRIPAKAVRIDRVYAKRFSLDNDDIFMVPQFKDPVGTGNYYRIRQWVNGVLIKGSYVRNDQAADGFTYESQLFYSTDEEDGNPLIKQGDRMTAELQSVDKGVYDYFRTLSTTIDQDASTPSNPLSNISGGALGYFNACYSHTLTAIAKY
jgi:hypothetical protein